MIITHLSEHIHKQGIWKSDSYQTGLFLFNKNFNLPMITYSKNIDTSTRQLKVPPVIYVLSQDGHKYSTQSIGWGVQHASCCTMFHTCDFQN